MSRQQNLNSNYNLQNFFVQMHTLNCIGATNTKKKLQKLKKKFNLIAGPNFNTFI